MLIDLEPVPKELKGLYNSWKGKRDAFLVRARQAKEYYAANVEGTNTNYRIEQLEKLKAMDLVPVSINYIYPQVAQKAAIINQNKYGHKISSTDGRFKEVAYVMEKAKDLILNSSEAVIEVREAIKEALITGISHLSWVFDWGYSEDSGFGLKLMHIPVENIILDPNTKKRSNIDMRGYFYVNTYTSDIIEQIYTPYLNIINEYYRKGKDPFTIDHLISHNYSREITSQQRLVTSLEQKTVEVVKYYTKQYAELYFVDMGDGIIKRVFRENFFPEEFAILEQTGQIVKKYTDRFIKETTIINDKIIEIKIIDSREFLLSTLYYEWFDNPYESKGMVHFIVGMQQVIDRVIQDLLYNSRLINAAGWTAPVDSIPEEYRKEWESKAASPSIKFYVPKIYENLVLKPERDQQLALPAHYMTIINLMYETMKISTGVSEIVTGDITPKIETFATAQLYQTAAMYRTSEFADYVSHFLAKVGQTLTEILPGLIKPDVHYQFLNPESDDFDEFAVTKEQLNLLTQIRFNVTAIPSAISPTARANMVTSLMNIAQTTADPYQRDIYLKNAYEMADMRGFDKLKQQLDTLGQLQNQIEILNDQIKRDKELMKQWENRVINTELENKILREQIGITARLIRAEEAAKRDTIDEALESKIKKE